MDTAHRLVLRWCAYLELDDVLRIDHRSVHVALHDPVRAIGARLIFGDGRFPFTVVPAGLVIATQRYVLERSRARGVVARHDVPIFDESYGEPITRASLSAAIRRALVLVRLSDAYLGEGPRRAGTARNG